MATITPTLTTPGPRAQQWTITWEQINQDDQGGSVDVAPGIGLGYIMFTGTFDTGTYTLEASNDDTNWEALEDKNGNTITATSDDTGFTFFTTARYLRIANDGSGTTEDVDVTLQYQPLVR